MTFGMRALAAQGTILRHEAPSEQVPLKKS